MLLEDVDDDLHELLDLVGVADVADCRGERLGDVWRDRSTELDGAADGAQPVVRALHGLGQHLAGGVAVVAGRERDAERHGDVGESVAVVVADLVGADIDVERLGRRPVAR